MKLLPLLVIGFILIGALLCSCDSKITDNPCDTCGVPCDTCDTTLPCDTCDTTDPTPNTNDTSSHDFTWTEYTIPGEANITGCAVLGKDSILLLGSYIYWFDGGTFKIIDPIISPNRHFSGGLADFALFALSSSNYWMPHGSIVFHVYEELKAEEFRPGSANACWGVADNDMFFVGNAGYILHYNGSSFTKFPQVTTKPLYSVWGTSHNDVWAAGFNSSTGEVSLLHFDGASWSEVDLKTVGWIGVGKHALTNVWATDSANHKVVIASGSNIWRKTDNKSWRSDSGLISNALPGGGFVDLGIRGNNVNDILAAGGWGWVGHWNGRTWKQYTQLFDYGNPFFGAYALSIKGNTACVVGVKSGQSWIAIGRRK